MTMTQTDIEQSQSARRLIVRSLVASAAVLASLAPATSADAALYQARQCNANGTEAHWGTNGDGQRYSAENTCGAGSGNRWLRTLTRTNGLTTANLTYGRWRMDAPSGTTFAGVAGSWYHSLRNNFTHRLVFASGSMEREIRKATNAVQPSPASFSDTSSGWARFESQMFCSAGGSNRCAQDPESWVAVSGLTFTLSDVDPPAIGVGGSLTTGGAKSGVQSFDYYGQDSGSGMRQSRMYLDGEFTAVTHHPCNEGNYGGVVQATTLRPCSTNGNGGSFSVDTRLLADGTHTVQYCAMDFAGFASGQLSRCSEIVSFVVDSTPPAAPQNLRVAGGEDWHADNDFDATWEIPSQGSGSRVTAVRYRVVAAGYDSGAQTLTGPATSLSNLRVPGKGTYELRVGFRDEGGNESEATAAKATLRLDDLRPGLARPQLPSGWLSRPELEAGHAQLWGRPAPLPLSGIRGYAIRIDQSQDGEPCAAADRCRPEELYLVGDSDEGRVRVINDLPEGTSYFHSVAVSNSLLKSSPVGTAPLRVDKTPPGVELSGAPSGWTNREVSLEARATDGLSGMGAASGDDGRPITAIRTDGDDPITVSGGRLEQTVAAEGAHTISYWARDLAGNEAAPRQVALKIDRTAPDVSFAGQDRTDPDQIRARAFDSLSGVVNGQISFRRAGSSQFQDLPTQRVGDELLARVDSDRFEDGAYEFRVEAVDAAGNRAISDRRSDGSPMVLQLPLKLRTSLSARFSPGPAASTRKPRCKQRSRAKRRRCRRRARRAGRPVAQASNVRVVPYGIGSRVEGVLRTITGEPVTGQPLTVTADPDAGSAGGPASLGGSTSGGGEFAVYVPPGPSRTIRVSFAGSQTLARSSSEPLRLLAPSRASLRITPRRIRNRQRILIRGTVAHAGARIPARGKLVEIQFYDSRRRRWRSVQLLRTDAAGRFEYSYRFLYIDRPSRIRFRAVAVAEAGWPYLASATRSVSVSVYPG